MYKTYILILSLFLLWQSAKGQTTTFYYTGAAQTYTVTAGVTAMTVDVKGACGGNGYIYSRGGYGGQVVCTLAVTPGQVLSVHVGGAGTNATSGIGVVPGGYNGGGSQPYTQGGGGGGASDIRMGGTGLSNRVIVAGGGGGGGFQNAVTNAEQGGGGGGTEGEYGKTFGSYTYSAGSYSYAGGGGGSASSGGEPGYQYSPTTTFGNVGTSGIGGDGGSTGNGGGGGGGYYGGGGGAFSGGGGGSSYTHSSFTSGVTHTQGINSSGHGQVVITPICVTSITGSTFVCAGATTTLTGSVTGGTWRSSTTSVATVGSATGIVSGVTSGTAVITYAITLPCGSISSTATVTVNPIPSVISGVSPVCIGNTITLASFPFAGTWSSGSPGIAAVGTSSGIVMGMSAGSAIITYAAGVGTSCTRTTTITVNPLPATITGDAEVCAGLTASLSTISTGGTWTSASTTVATIATTGVVTGVLAGTALISYSIPTGCRRIITVTVNPLPAPISGVAGLCNGATTTLSNSGGGTWTSSGGAAAIGASTGLLSGILPGTSLITYTISTGCTTITTATVFPLPAAITGTVRICDGAVSILSSISSGGTWVSSAPSVATVSSASGAVAGRSGGTTFITYILPTGCSTITTVTVYPLPVAITGTTALCVGTTGSLISTPGGTWISSSTGVAAVGFSTGLLVGIAPGTSRITYTMPAGCSTTTTITVNALPEAITGRLGVCISLTSSLSSATAGGTWLSSNPSVVIGSSTGVVTGAAGGTAVVTYRLPTGCIATATVTVATAPDVITGPAEVCAGEQVTLSNATGGGLWSADGVLAAADGATGVVSGLSAGLSSITYSLGGSCVTSRTLTVHPLPAPIAGTMNVCEGLSTGLTDASLGGTWSSAATGTVIIGASTGIAYGIAAGVAVVSYQLATTGCVRTATVTVNPLPLDITGTATVCAGLATTLSNATIGGTWISSAPTIAAVGSTTAIISGIVAGTSVITYRLSATGCIATKVTTVHPLPAAITGPGAVCEGATIVLSGPTGGVWTSSTLAIGATSGIVTGTVSGPAVITYTLPTGCINTRNIIVNPLPSAISGPTAVCVGAAATLATASSGGWWTSSMPTTASVGSATGIVSGLTIGTTIISYTLPTGCAITTTLAVSLTPVAIAGPLSVCVGNTAAYSNAISGGSWFSSSSLVSVGSSSGIVSGISSGIATITYSLGTGCTVIKTISVNPSPEAISGPSVLCAGVTISLADGTAGGAWVSRSSGIASVGASTGVVTGISAGATVISYLMPTGCFALYAVTVNASPAAITGAATVCEGGTATWSNAISGGTWYATGTNATINAITGVVTGISPGTSLITYTLAAGCLVTRTVTVNSTAILTGTMLICAGHSGAMSASVTGGVWSSGNPGVAIISTGGVINALTPGTAAISYTLPTGCRSVAVVAVNESPGPITGTLHSCIGESSLLGNSIAGGEWTAAGGAGITADRTTGIVTGISGGTAMITYSTGAGCRVTSVFTVNVAPATTGVAGLCTGRTTTLANPVPGGTWTADGGGVASIDRTTGVVTGIVPGTAAITYTPAGCPAITTVTVFVLPAAITGTRDICVGQTVTMTNATAGGTWSSTSISVAADGPTGAITGLVPGVAAISYSTGIGCSVAMTVTVNALPSITGVRSICPGGRLTLANAVAGGNWTSSSPTTAVAGSGSGEVTGISYGTAEISYAYRGCVVSTPLSVSDLPPITGLAPMCASGDTLRVRIAETTGVWSSTVATIVRSEIVAGEHVGLATAYTAGTATITYTLPTGCRSTGTLTVKPLPPAIGGDWRVCVGSTTSLTDAEPGGTWSTAHTSLVAVGTGGAVVGISAGLAMISYTSAITGCSATASVVVLPLPDVITGTAYACAGNTATLFNATIGGTWGSSSTAIATVDVAGTVTGVSGGRAVISYATGSGCVATREFTVRALPTIYPVTGGGVYCSGGPGLPIGLSGSEVGVNYQLYRGGGGIGGALAGTGTALSFGTHTVTGIYSVAAVNTITGCAIAMADSASVDVSPLVVPALTIETSIADTVCAGTAVTFSASGTGGGTSPGYIWTVNGSLAGAGPIFTYVPENADIVAATLTSSAPCAVPATVTRTVTVDVKAMTPVSVIITAYPGVSVALGTVVTLTAAANGTMAEYQWSVNGASITGAMSSDFSSIFADGDSVSCRVRSTGLCLVPGSGWLRMIAGHTGTKTVTSNSSLSILPNPSNGTFRIIGATSENTPTAEIADMTGRIVYRQVCRVKNSQMDEQISIAKLLPDGTYVLRVAGQTFVIIIAAN